METQKLNALIDKQEITEVIYRLARGLDRCDEALLRGCYHADATDDHGIFKGAAEDFFPWVIPMLRGMESTMHFIGNVLIELTGADAARAESYFTAYHRIAGPTDMIVAGRYLDRFTRRAGEWRIAHRAAVYDYNITQPASDAAWGAPEMQAVLARGKRAPDDASCRDLAL
jgi:hypothetical protein